MFQEHIDAVDCGDNVADWLTSYMGHPESTFRLLCHPLSEEARTSVEGVTAWNKDCKPQDQVGIYFTLISAASSWEHHVELTLFSGTVMESTWILHYEHSGVFQIQWCRF